MIRHRASAEIAAMLIVSIFCCYVAERYQRSAAPDTISIISGQTDQEQENTAAIATLPAVSPEITDAAGAEDDIDAASISDSAQTGALKSSETETSEAAKKVGEKSTVEEISAEEATAEETTAEEATAEETTAEKPSAAPEEEPQTAAELMAQAPPSPSRLNMVYEFASDIPGEPEESYAGTVYYRLTARDEDWISQMYGNRTVAPGILAVSLGITGKNLGNYSDWTNVGLLFYDGDGNMIQGYSNAREILAMASVYAYFHPFDNIDDFYQYAEQLWEASHKYNLSVSDVYFCEGECKYMDSHIDEDDSDLSWSDPDGILSAGTSAGDGALSDRETTLGSGQGPLDPLTSDAGTAPSASDPVTTETAAETEAAPAETAAMSAETSPAIDQTVAQNDQGENTAAETAAAPAGHLGPMAVSSEITAESSETTAPSAHQGPPGPSSLPVTEETFSVSETVPETEPVPEKTTPASAETAPGPADQTSAVTENVSPQQSSSSAGTVTDENKCQGHVDLTIRATVIGLNESNKNLFKLDSQGSSDKTYTDTWKGWSMLRKRYVAALLEQDWFDLYGLTIPASMYIQNPLTAAEIQYYMNMMPEDTSEERRTLIKLALQSVGCIPYYWGGKPSGPGYEANGFGRLVAPDENGRSLRGLDCSGWISWLYWTALGRHLPFESTNGLYALGRQVDRSELKPGDYIVRTGDDAHVCLFLAWAPDGTMYVIHERGSSTNNVIVSNFDLYWPYYRNLLD